MKIVLDTNVLSVAIARRSKFHPIWQGIRNGHLELLVTNDILGEYEEIIGQDLSPDVANFVMRTLETLPNVLLIQKYYFWNLIVADPDDDKFVDCAVAGNADYLVTDDRDFRVLETVPFPKVHVLTAHQFLELIVPNID